MGYVAVMDLCSISTVFIHGFREMKRGFPGELFIYAGDLCCSSNPFYQALGQLLCEEGSDAFVEDICREFYADDVDRPGCLWIDPARLRELDPMDTKIV